MRHLGKNKSTEARYAVVSMSLPDDNDHCLVVEYDTLPIRYQDALMNVIYSNEAQAETKLLNVLSRRRFPDGDLMHAVLFQSGRIVRMPTSEVIMTPDNSNSINLKELNERLQRPNLPNREVIDAEDATVEKILSEIPNTDNTRTSHIQHNLEVSSTENSKRIARQLVFEAEMIQQQAEMDVQERLKRAYALDPSLKPKPAPVKKAAAKKASTKRVVTRKQTAEK